MNIKARHKIDNKQMMLQLKPQIPINQDYDRENMEQKAVGDEELHIITNASGTINKIHDITENYDRYLRADPFDVDSYDINQIVSENMMLVDYDNLASPRQANKSLKRSFEESSDDLSLSMELPKPSKNNETEFVKELTEALKLEIAKLKNITDDRKSGLENEIDQLLTNAKAYMEKFQIDKLSRQFNDALIFLQHEESFSINAKFEYLKSIIFQYLTNDNTNSDALLKEIENVLTYSPEPLQAVLEREAQRKTTIDKTDTDIAETEPIELRRSTDFNFMDELNKSTFKLSFDTINSNDNITTSMFSVESSILVVCRNEKMPNGYIRNETIREEPTDGNIKNERIVEQLRIPKKISKLKTFLKEKLRLLSEDLGNVHELCKFMIKNEKLNTRKGTKNANGARKKLNIILTGRAGLAAGPYHLDQLKSLLQKESLTKEDRNAIKIHYKYIFSPLERHNYPQLISQYELQLPKAKNTQVKLFRNSSLVLTTKILLIGRSK